MMNFIFFSPLEQFEFTFITGKLIPNFSTLEILLPLDKNVLKDNLLIGETSIRDQTKVEVSWFLTAVNGLIGERAIFPSAFKESYTNYLTECVIANSLYSGEEGKRWYKNLEFFYIWEEGTVLIELFYDIFERLGKDDGNLFNWDVCFLDEKFEKIGIVFETNKSGAVLPIDSQTYAIMAGYVLTDLYLPHNPAGLNPTLTFLTNCFYNWIVDRILLNELFTIENVDLTTKDFYNNKIGLSAVDMNKRDETNIAFFWLNIYNSLFIVITLIILIFIVFNQGYAKVPNIWQILNNLTFDFLVKSFISLANRNLLSFFPIFFCFFIFIYLLNLTALTPFSFCLTSNLWFSLSLSFSVWFGVTALAIIVRGEEFFLGFVPKNIDSNELKVFITIIEVISYVARSLSLGVRIFANMLAGHSLVHILSDLTATCFVEFDNIGLKIFGIFPAIILSFILVIEFGICFLQGLVFVILTAIYLKEAFQGH